MKWMITKELKPLLNPGKKDLSMSVTDNSNDLINEKIKVFGNYIPLYTKQDGNKKTIALTTV